MKHRLAVVLGAVALVLGLGAITGTSAVAGASTWLPVGAPTGVHVLRAGHNPVKSGHVPEALCNLSNPSLCLNRNQCGSGANTVIIGWTHDLDNCEDSYWFQLSLMCGNGVVTGTCPFAVGSGLNSRYAGDPIVAIGWYDAGGCVAANPNGSTVGVTGTCPDPYGNGGSNGSIFVYNTKNNADYMINRYWSDYFYQHGDGANNPSGLCTDGFGNPVLLGNEVQPLPSGICQFREASS